MVEQISSRVVKWKEGQPLTWPWKILWVKHAGWALERKAVSQGLLSKQMWENVASNAVGLALRNLWVGPAWGGHWHLRLPSQALCTLTHRSGG